jgi:hypothetical protein
MKRWAVFQHVPRGEPEHLPPTSTIDRERRRKVERAGRSLFGRSFAATTARRQGGRT